MQQARLRLNPASPVAATAHLELAFACFPPLPPGVSPALRGDSRVFLSAAEALACFPSSCLGDVNVAVFARPGPDTEWVFLRIMSPLPSDDKAAVKTQWTRLRWLARGALSVLVLACIVKSVSG